MPKNSRPAGGSCCLRSFPRLKSALSRVLIAGPALTLVACGLHDGQRAQGEPVAIRRYSNGGSVPPPARPEWKLQLSFDGESTLDYWPGRTYREVSFPDWRLVFQLTAEQKAGLRASLQAMDLPQGGLPSFHDDGSVGGGRSWTEFQFTGGVLVLPGDAEDLDAAFENGRRDLNQKIEAALPPGHFDRLDRHADAFQAFVGVDYLSEPDMSWNLATLPLAEAAGGAWPAFSECDAPAATPADLASDTCLPPQVSGRTITLPSGAPGVPHDLSQNAQTPGQANLSCTIHREGDALVFEFEGASQARHPFVKEAMHASRASGSDVRTSGRSNAELPWRVWRQAGWTGLPVQHDAAMLSVFEHRPGWAHGAREGGVIGMSAQGGQIRYCLARYALE